MKVLFSECGRQLCDVWIDRTLKTYSAEYARFAAANRNPFSNPLGGILKNGLSDLFAALLDGAQPAACREALEQIVRVKAVQDVPPSEALAFIPALKEIVRDHFRNEPKDEKTRNAVAEFEANVDKASVVAFDIYTECREKIYELRINELKRNTAGLLRQKGRLRPVSAKADDASCSAACESEKGCRP